MMITQEKASEGEKHQLKEIREVLHQEKFRRVSNFKKQIIKFNRIFKIRF